MKARAEILIAGRVQGVFFRRSVTDLAHRLGVTGWVRNLADGSVEVNAEGERASLDELLLFCRIGPEGARVERVDVSWSPFKGEFQGFKIVHATPARSQGLDKLAGEPDSS